MAEGAAKPHLSQGHHDNSGSQNLALRMMVDRLRAFTTAPAMPTSSGAEWLQLRTWMLRDDWVINLAESIGSARWWRGAFSLTSLITAALLTHPSTHKNFLPPESEAVAPIIKSNPQKTPLSTTLVGMDHFFPAPPKAGVIASQSEVAASPASTVRFLKKENGIPLTRLFEKAGLSTQEAQEIEKLITTSVPKNSISNDTAFHIITLPPSSSLQARRMSHLNFRASFDSMVNIDRGTDGLKLTQYTIPFVTRPIKFSFSIDKNIKEDSQTAGIPASLADKIEQLLKRQLPNPRLFLRHKTRLNIVLNQRENSLGEKAIGDPLYIALAQTDSQNTTRKSDPVQVQLFKWEKNGQIYWLDNKGQAPLVSPNNFILPVAGRISSPFGYRFHPILGFTRFHKGIDISSPYGTAVKSASAGRVTFAGRKSGYGNFATVNHGQGIETAYAHMSCLHVHQGQIVQQGQTIGQIGTSGLSTGPHLHYEVHYNNAPVNPDHFIQSAHYQLTGPDLVEFKQK
ncbi:murein DD-endopeptidase MepM/ murein hydrolase activator NlpD [Zymomonas mobilis]|uniref:Murein DD-endopeptidase MepM/ murein hydrolase activator NlpD n=1 Tax=Zymomonas mobilis TaxID=542 RepID=A0A542VZJ6_ZYMMB|nr:M23 family metallopeptidase [Zymomonas mobilis]TQL16752.1 murein DD-endopeptidase MepM/ murein hydrolase activator NlpD [Zymomonas mobilis]